MRSAPHPDKLVELFDALFSGPENTRLVRGAGEPLYLPPGKDGPQAQVVFAHGFFASALHEIAHWCVAGASRRQAVDYGYWYKPDGRSATEQREFETVEVKPQALEWIFSVAAGTIFHFSADNLGGEVSGVSWERFQRSVEAQARAYATAGLPARAAAFAAALSRHFGTGEAWREARSYRRS